MPTQVYTELDEKSLAVSTKSRCSCHTRSLLPTLKERRQEVF